MKANVIENKSEIERSENHAEIINVFETKVPMNIQAVIDKSLDLEKSREEMTPYFLALSRKLDFHFSLYSQFSRFLEKNSISLLDL